MGLRNALAVWRSELVGRPIGPMPRPQLSSPWAVGDLSQIVWADVFGLDTLPPSRSQAMQVAALARAVNLFKTTVARCPLVALALDQPVTPQPSWLQRTDGLTAPFHRMLGTVDDHIFCGESLWLRTNNADGSIRETDRLPYDEWAVNDVGEILVFGEVVDSKSVIYLPGPHEGILRFGAKAIRAAASLENAALDTARHPFRVHLHQTTDEELSAAEKRSLIGEARAAMYENGGVLFTNAAVTAELMPFDSSQLLVEGRNAAAVDMARLVASPAALVDATAAGASLTYETTAGRNQQLIDYGIAGYMAAIEGRLSMDDCVPRGQRVAFDTTNLTQATPAPTGPVTED